MSPLMNVAMLLAAALVWSAVLEMVNWFSRSSSTLTDFWFSALVFAAFEGTESMTSTEGIVMNVRPRRMLTWGFQGLKTRWKIFVQLKTNRVSHSESPRGSALYKWLSFYAKKKVYRERPTTSVSGRQKREWSG